LSNRERLFRRQMLLNDHNGTHHLSVVCSDCACPRPVHYSSCYVAHNLSQRTVLSIPRDGNKRNGLKSANLSQKHWRNFFETQPKATKVMKPMAPHPTPPLPLKFRSEECPLPGHLTSPGVNVRRFQLWLVQK
jgi:hypothetical protein